MYRYQKVNAMILHGFLSLLMVVPSTVLAHGGGAVEFDDCRIPIIGQWVHFTAYTPRLTGDAEFCNVIPRLGLTTLVFDYEQKPLRKMLVEFEITKEPGGKRVFYQEPTIHKTGSMNAAVNFSEFGMGEYLVHVTLLLANQKIDAHLPFSIGAEERSSRLLWVLVFAVFGLLLCAYFVPSDIRSKVNVFVWHRVVSR
ncbi:MAG: hypothetical protein K0U68_05080 [Gammaproteobacteria bacterium]|nr:hypothetical protein [Gammaproteobacteria bacterium]